MAVKDKADVDRVREAMTNYLNFLKGDLYCNILHELFDHEGFQLTLAYDLRASPDEMFVDWRSVDNLKKVDRVAHEHCIAVDQLICVEFRDIVGRDAISPSTLRMSMYFNSPRLNEIFSSLGDSLDCRQGVYTLDIEMINGVPQGLESHRAGLESIFAKFDLSFGSLEQDVGFFLFNTDCFVTYINPQIAVNQLKLNQQPVMC